MWHCNQYTSGKFDRVANAVSILAEHAPEFEYAGGFTSVDGPIQVRCKACGHIQTRSMITIRHKHIACDNCRAIEAERKEKAKQDERRKAEAERQEQKRKKRICAHFTRRRAILQNRAEQNLYILWYNHWHKCIGVL